MELGNILKIYGALPLVTDITSLDALFDALGSARCLCREDGSDDWAACVE